MIYVIIIIIICIITLIYIKKEQFNNTAYKKMLVVTAMYNIAGKHSTDSYKKYISNWFPYFVNGNMVIFCDDYYYDYINELRKDLMDKTTIIKKPIEEFKVYKEFNDFFKSNNEKIKDVYNIDYRKQLIWGEKVNFMYEGLKIYPQSEYIAWFDGGYFRDDVDKEISKTLFTNLSKIDSSKIYMVVVTSNDWLNILSKEINNKKGHLISDYHIDYNMAHFTGGFILCHKNKMQKLYDLFYSILNKFKQADKEFLDDQYIFAFMVLDNENINLFELLSAPPDYKKNVWFYAKDYFQ